MILLTSCQSETALTRMAATMSFGQTGCRACGSLTSPGSSLRTLLHPHGEGQLVSGARQVCPESEWLPETFGTSDSSRRPDGSTRARAAQWRELEPETP